MMNLNFTHLLKNNSRAWRAMLPLLALFVMFGFAHTAQAQNNSSIVSTTVIIDRGAGNETYGGKNAPSFTPFNGASLGAFDLSDFSTRLLLNGGTIVTQESAPDVILASGTTITYRVRKNNPDGTFTNFAPVTFTVPQTNATTASPITRTFSTATANRNVLTGLDAGNYSLSVQFTANGTNANGDDFTLTDPPGAFYRANFLVTGVRPSEGPNSTTWTGGFNDNWFDARNWTQGIPSVSKDATIPDFGSGSTVPYPNIYSDATKPNSTTTTTIQNPDGTFSTITTQVQGYNNTGSGPAKTRNLIMQGSSQAQRSITRLVVGRLEVYGNFSNLQDSFIQRENTTIAFTGTNQTISGSASGFVNVQIDGGGIKTLERNFAVQAGGSLQFINGVLTTDITDVNTSFVELFPSTTTAGVVVPSGRITGETETSYLRGFIKTSQVTGVVTAQDFGNIGLTLRFFGNDPGVVTVTRNTAENYPSINNGANSKPSIRRIFGVRPADQQSQNGGLNATLIFRYLNNELTDLPKSTGQTLDETKLALFLSTSSGDVFGQLGRDNLNTATNELTKTNVTSFATFTLSEFTQPLPVALVAFNAKRVGNNAELNWETATETNNKGFEVQVSNNGRDFRTLAFVESQAVNSNRLLKYRYVDTEPNKSGTLYYRLRQIDVDGKATFSPVRVLNYNTAAKQTGTQIAAYPNPFTTEMNVELSAIEAGPARLRLTDLTGRVLREEAVVVPAGTAEFKIDALQSVGAGVYMVQLVPASGKTQTVRVQKQ